MKRCAEAHVWTFEQSNNACIRKPTPIWTTSGQFSDGKINVTDEEGEQQTLERHRNRMLPGKCCLPAAIVEVGCVHPLQLVS